MFFVVRDLDVTQRGYQQQICGRFTTCDKFSLANILEQEFKRLKKSMIAEPTSNWLDDFLTWLNPDLDQCCRFKNCRFGNSIHLNFVDLMILNVNVKHVLLITILRMMLV